jgi:heptosyltransferase-3
MRILFISGNRIGDAVITCGVLDHLVRTYPHAKITIACGPAAEQVFARVPNRERTIVFEKQPYDRHWFGLWRQVVGTMWDMVVDFRGSAMGYVVLTKKRAIKRRGPGRMYEQCAAVLGLNPAPLPVVWTNDADKALAARLLHGDRPVIGIGPTANWPPKMWAADRFAALVARLRAERWPDAACIVFAGPGEKERALAEPALRLIPDAIDARGTLALSETAACLQRCSLFVGNDSGLMHLAAAAGTPTIGLCAATLDRADEMAPIGLKAAWAKGDGPDMSQLSVRQVYEDCCRLMQVA